MHRVHRKPIKQNLLLKQYHINCKPKLRNLWTGIIKDIRTIVILQAWKVSKLIHTRDIMSKRSTEFYINCGYLVNHKTIIICKSKFPCFLIREKSENHNLLKNLMKNMGIDTVLFPQNSTQEMHCPLPSRIINFVKYFARSYH